MKTWLLVCLGAVSLVPLQAQEYHRLIFDFGAGFVEPVGAAGRSLDTGWTLKAGAGMNFTSMLGAMVQVESDSMGINSTTLSNIGFPGGNVRVFSATIDPIVHLTPHKRFDAYLIGGGGMYRVSENFTGSGTNDDFVNPFFGGGLLASSSVVKPGWNGGVGLALGSKWGGKFYAEARYHHVYMNDNVHMNYVPVSFGYRW